MVWYPMTEEKPRFSEQSDPDSTSSERDHNQYPKYWKSPIIHNQDGAPIGVSIFLTLDDLARLEIEVDSCKEVRYTVTEAGMIDVVENETQLME